MVVLKEPLPQALQMRPVVAVPSLTTYCPATHAVLGAHAVAGSPS
jgi:hypothetical protein